MSSLFVERVGVVTAGFAVAVAYLVGPGGAQAATCEILPRSFDCMAGHSAKTAATKTDASKEIKVASVAPTGVVSDATAGAEEETAKPRSSRKASSRASKKRSASSRRGRNSRSKEVASKDNTTRNGWRTRSGGFQARGGVVTSCFPARLRGLLAQVSKHYGKKLVITSGYRSRAHNRRIGGAKESQHIHCTAADFYIPGVAPGRLAAYLKGMPGRGGVGTYCGNRTVHLDVGTRREWHWGCRGHGRSRYARRSARQRYAAARRARVKQHYAAARMRGSRS